MLQGNFMSMTNASTVISVGKPHQTTSPAMMMAGTATPESPEEEAQCKEAMEGCPVEAIGSDGQ
jgi:ferredoxin